MDDCEVLDNDLLISLVEVRPVLWDTTLDKFTDRNATINAWKEVCCAMNEDFVSMEDKEKNKFMKAVRKRWANLRDAFSKSLRLLEKTKKRGAGARRIKKYRYASEMQFLNKLRQSREVAESLDVSGGNCDDKDSDNGQFLQVAQGITVQEKSYEDNTSSGSKKRRHLDDLELKIIEPINSPHMSFFQGLLPHLQHFNDDEVLDFQMGVLQVISQIRSKQKDTQLLPPPTHSYNYNFPLSQSPT